MTPEDGQADGGVPGLSMSRRRRIAVVTGLVAVLAVVAVVGGLVLGRSPRGAAAAPAAATSRAALPTADTVAPTPSASPSLAAQPTVIPGKEKYLPPPMSPAQLAATRAELTALAARLPASVALTAPGAWARYAGRTPEYDQDIVSCPHIADRLAADLGTRWTYSYGKLPQGPYGCYWTPVPWVPDVSRFFVSIGYETGTVADLMHGMDFCAGGVEAPSLAVPQVGRGAVLYGCDDANGPGYTVALPDSAGSGVFFLSSTGGPRTPQPQVAAAMLAVIDGATRSYG